MIEYGSKIIMLLLENKKIKNKKVKILRFSKRPGLKKKLVWKWKILKK